MLLGALLRLARDILPYLCLSLGKRLPLRMSGSLCSAAFFDLVIPAFGLGGFEDGGVPQLQDSVDRVD